MHQPSRVLQHGAHNTSRRIAFSQRRSIGIGARNAKHLSTPADLHTSGKLSNNPVNENRNYGALCKHRYGVLLPCLNPTGAHDRPGFSTRATSPRHDATERIHTPFSMLEELEEAELDALDGGIIDWDDIILRMDRTHGVRGVCAVMDRLREREHLEVIVESDRVRSAILYAAIQSPTDRQNLFSYAEDLLQQFDYRWPNLYTRSLHHLLENGAFKDAIQAHLRLAPKFLPEAPVLAMFFQNFVLHSDTKMQLALKTIYASLPQHSLYDTIIPALFESGQSNLAKSWRRSLLARKDFPLSESSQPFLAFLAAYFTTTNFTPEEHRIIELGLERREEKTHSEKKTIEHKNTAVKRDRDTETGVMASAKHDAGGNEAQPRPETKTLVDRIIEKLFASSWTPADFAMKLAKNAGIQSIGFRAFQALALRASSATEVNNLIKTLQKLDISIPSGAYCTAISEFAKQGDDSLLNDLLHSDIHPEEFDDQETRQMILENSIRRRDTGQEHLMRGVIGALNAYADGPPKSAFQLNTAEHTFPLEKLLFDEPWKMKLALDRMVSLDFRLGPDEASAILRRAFAAFPSDSRGVLWNSKECAQIMDEVIGVVRCVAAQNVAIRTGYWRMLLLGLGHQGRFDTMEQLSLELVDMYDYNLGGWFPVHKSDLPKSSTLAAAFLERTKSWGYIPADLSFYHHHHPIFKIFDDDFQRSVVQLGCDCALRLGHDPKSKPAIYSAIVARYNVACGIHILANLRDRGVFIDVDVVESAARNGIYFSQRMRQRDGDTRGRRWLSSTQMKHVMDLAWGSTLMPTHYIESLNKKDMRALPALQGDWFCSARKGKICK